jgi:hypothetical protein
MRPFCSSCNTSYHVFFGCNCQQGITGSAAAASGLPAPPPGIQAMIDSVAAQQEQLIAEALGTLVQGSPELSKVDTNDANNLLNDIQEALSMKEDGYEPVPLGTGQFEERSDSNGPVEQLPAKSYGDLAVRNSKGLCTCSIVQLMQAGCRCNGA